MGMKVWLDGLRSAPDGWQHVRCPEDAIVLLFKGRVAHISLDYDLGDDKHGTGYDVLLWIEQATMMGSFRPPEIVVHAVNVSARQKMLAAVEKIKRIEKSRLEGAYGQAAA